MSAPSGQAYRECWFSAQDGLGLYYRDYGDPLAPNVPLLCLSGLARTSKDFADFAGRQAVRRRVICPDYRGRGRSAYDSNWRNYRPETYLRDLAALLAATGLHRIALCGTSLGGLLSMGLAVTNPTVLAGVILNDVGPVIELSGLARIRKNVARDAPLPDWDAAVAEVKELHAELNYDSEDKWLRLAESTYRQDENGQIRVDWDVRIARGLGGEVPDLWPFFRAIRHRPVLALRGERSSVLSDATFKTMRAEHPNLIQVTVPGVGHAPALDEPIAEAAIDDFLTSLDS